MLQTEASSSPTTATIDIYSPLQNQMYVFVYFMCLFISGVRLFLSPRGVTLRWVVGESFPYVVRYSQSQAKYITAQSSSLIPRSISNAEEQWASRACGRPGTTWRR